MRKTELIVALDYSEATRAFALVKELKGLPLIYKVGFELFLRGGPEVVQELKSKKQRVFLDLKLHDIPATVGKAAMQMAALDIDFLTMHLTGGRAMFQETLKELQSFGNNRPKILGVSVLTSFDAKLWAEVSQALSGKISQITDAVTGLVACARLWGVDGVVCSALELAAIRKNNPELFLVTPGIRPPGTQVFDQSRVVTPKEAHQAGADAIVVGRPITQAENPREIAEAILKDISE